MNLERLYLDYNATSPLSHLVIDWLKSGDLLFGNPSSQHFRGKISRKVINEARRELFSAFNKNENVSKLFYHSGATEGIHSFAYSFAEMARLAGKDLLICYSSVDHPATTSLGEKFFGHHVEFFELARNNNLQYEDGKNFEFIKDKKANNPNLIVLYHHLWVHNETGHVSPLRNLTKLKTIPDLYVHVDAVQAPGKIPDWRELIEGDIWTFSGHKFGALKGIGFSFFKSSIDFYPFISGGGQQGQLRSGTENIQGIQSVALALKDLLKVDVKQNSSQRLKLEKFIKESLKGIGEVISGENMASNTIYFYLNNLSSDLSLALFDLNGVEISAGSACSSGTAKESLVLKQMGLTSVLRNGLRLSMALEVSEESLKEIQGRLTPIFNRLHKN